MYGAAASLCVNMHTEGLRAAALGGSRYDDWKA